MVGDRNGGSRDLCGLVWDDCFWVVIARDVANVTSVRPVPCASSLWKLLRFPRASEAFTHQQLCRMTGDWVRHIRFTFPWENRSLRKDRTRYIGKHVPDSVKAWEGRKKELQPLSPCHRSVWIKSMEQICQEWRYGSHLQEKSQDQMRFLMRVEEMRNG